MGDSEFVIIAVSGVKLFIHFVAVIVILICRCHFFYLLDKKLVIFMKTLFSLLFSKTLFVV